MNAYPEYKESGIDWLGKIPSHWKIIATKRLFNIYSGATPQSSNDKYWDGEIAWITPADFNTKDHYILSSDRTITHDGYNSCSTELVPRGSIVFSKRAPIGKVAIAAIDLCSNQGCLCCVPNTIANSNFFYYLMSILGDAYNQLGSGSTFLEIAAQSFANFKLIFPPIDEQKAIAAYLDEKTGKIDKLIAEKTKQVEDLRSFRTSVITEAVTHGLNPNVPLRQSGIDWLGEIPEHWNESKLKYIGEARNGLTYSPEDISDENGLLVLRSSNIQNERLSFNDNVYVSKQVDELMMREGDILICSRNGSASLVGKCAIIPSDINATFGAFMMRYRSKIDKKFTLYLVRTTLAQYKSKFATSTINQLTNTMIGDMQVPVPPISEQQEIANYLDEKTAKIDKLINELNNQLAELAEYKQAVISEAVTGKVDVRDYKSSL
jgi:type I restriction enzyme S subunit